MAHKILVFYGSYRSDRMGIRLANFIVARLRARGDTAELIDAKDVGLPMLDRMYKEYPPGSAPRAMEALASKIRAADAFVFIVGEYNWGVQPGLKNLTDHFLEFEVRIALSFPEPLQLAERRLLQLRGGATPTTFANA
jgi:NAD(P)H-dependent FMN reductase